MRGLLKKISLPLAVAVVAATRIFASTTPNAGLEGPVLQCFEFNDIAAEPEAGVPDTVVYNAAKIFTKFRPAGRRGRVEGAFDPDSLSEEETGLLLSARDSIIAPDSLRLTDPFRYKYYVAIVDSLTHLFTRDSLRMAGDSLDWPRIDSLYYADSAIIAKRKFDEWYASLDKTARRKYDFDQKMKVKVARMDSIYAAKDSLLAIKDSIRENKPRILSTFAVPEDKHYERILSWQRDMNYNKVLLHDLDTSYNYYFNDYPFMRKDVNATYLGISGSPTQLYDLSKRDSKEKVSFYAPYELYSYSPGTIPMYNTKTAYTELAYWGTLFANTEREENNLHILATQNIFPELNYRLEYNRYGANGMLNRERTDNRTFAATVNYMGKRYMAQLGYISNKIDRTENGGIVDNFWIRDTTVGSREIQTHLSKASNLIKKKTVFLDQTYRIPFNFIKRMMDRRAAAKDSTLSLTGEEEASPGDAVTTAYIGHNSEYSVYSKFYTDDISASDELGREFYHDRFYINPTKSADSLRVMKLENKFFIRLQPWAEDAIVSSVNVGIGNRILNYYMFKPDGYLGGGGNTVWNSTYLYGGVGGKLKKYLEWGANGHYTFMGDEQNDTGIDANASLNLFPFRKHKDSPLALEAKFETKMEVPEYYTQHYYSNHYKWENNFSKISTTRIEASVAIPHMDLKLSAGYSILKNYIYYDSLGVVRQYGSPVNVAKIALTKNFRVWKLHFDNTALFQTSSNEKVLPLPKLALNLKWYLQADVVRNVMQMQLGANVTYTTKWHAPGYSPALGQFINQSKEKYGNSPYIDAFVNIQWKRACIFVKFVNLNMGWPSKHADYFSADGYIRPQKAIKFGIFWPFYLQTRKNSTVQGVSGGTSGNGGGNRQGSNSNGEDTSGVLNTLGGAGNFPTGGRSRNRLM